MRGRNGDARWRRSEQRRFDEDVVDHYRTLAREMNALRQDLRGRSTQEIQALLVARYGAELDPGRLKACAEAMAAGREVSLGPRAPRS